MDIWAEAGACDGDISYAIACVDAIAHAGADALKVQWHRPDMIFSADALRYDRVADHLGQHQAEASAKHLYPYDRWQPVIDRCHQRNINFIPAVFDGDAVIAASEMGVSILKIASGDITNRPLIELAAQHADQLVISTGASTMDEVTRAVTWAQNAGVAELILLACHLEYPTLLHDANLGRLIALQSQFSYDPNIHFGYSDHTEGTATTGLLTAMACQVQEKHFTLHPKTGGGDHMFAVGPDDLEVMVKGSQGVLAMIGNVELEPTPGEQDARLGARRSLYLRNDVDTHVTADDLIALRPANPAGYEPWELVDLFSDGKPKRIQKPMKAGDLLERRLVGGVGATLEVV